MGRFVISSLASGTKLAASVPPTWRPPSGPYLARRWLLKEGGPQVSRAAECGPASSSSDSHPVFVLDQHAHRSDASNFKSARQRWWDAVEDVARLSL